MQGYVQNLGSDIAQYNKYFFYKKPSSQSTFSIRNTGCFGLCWARNSIRNFNSLKIFIGMFNRITVLCAKSDYKSRQVWHHMHCMLHSEYRNIYIGDVFSPTLTIYITFGKLLHSLESKGRLLKTSLQYICYTVKVMNKIPRSASVKHCWRTIF